MQGKGTAQAAAHLQVAGFGVKFWSNPFCGQGFIELLAQALQLQSTPLVDPELSVVYPVPELTDSRRRWEAVGGQHGLVTVKATPEQNEFGRCERVHCRAVLRGIASVHRLDQPRSSRLAVRVSLVHPCNHVQPGHFGLCNTGAMSTIATHRVWDGGGWVDGWVGGGGLAGLIRRRECIVASYAPSEDDVKRTSCGVWGGAPPVRQGRGNKVWGRTLFLRETFPCAGLQYGSPPYGAP